MGLPKMRNETPSAARWAAMESPYGPAPIIATSTIGLMFAKFQPAFPLSFELRGEQARFVEIE
jgi:hypothetical protein